MSANIYIIEDEEPIITLIKYNLEKKNNTLALTLPTEIK